MSTTVKKFLAQSAQYLGVNAVPDIVVKWASTQKEIGAAQELRRRVFEKEFSVSFGSTHDSDDFDAYCQHLIAIDRTNGEIVGTYRLLLSEGMQRAGRWYMQDEFDVEWIRLFGHRVIELGRSCIHPAYRDGTALRKLWTALGLFLQERPESYLIGCVSVPVSENSHYLERLSSGLLAKDGFRDQPFGARPLNPLSDLKSATSAINMNPTLVMYPPLIRSYLKLGTKALGAPCYDPQFHCADFPMIVNIDTLVQRVLRTTHRKAA